VALRRGGADEIVVVGEGPLPPFRRLAALGIEPRLAAAAPGPQAGERITADGALFALPRDVRNVIETRGALVGLPLRFEGTSPTAPPAVAHEGPAFVVEDETSRKRAEDLLWASLGSSMDGVIDRWLNRPLGRLFSRILVRTSVTPNQITVFGTLIGIGGALLIAEGGVWTALFGAFVFQLSAAIDCVDGEIARVTFRESALGKWLDLWLDNAVHLALFVAIALHGVRSGAMTPTLSILLGVSTVVGALVSFAVVLRGMRIPPERRDRRIAAIIDRMTNRDFSILVVGFALLQHIEWFLWLSGTLSHAFWILAWIASARPEPVEGRMG